MSKEPDFSSFTPSKLNPKAAKQLAEVDKIIRKASDKDKQNLIEQGLSVKPMKGAVITPVKIKKIVTSAFFMRSKVYDSFDDLSTITELDPIKVAATEEAKLYVLIDGQRRLDHAKRSGAKEVEVQIIGTVVCQSQIGMARGKEMVKFKKPLTPLELAQGLMQLKNQIIRDFGEDAFFSHGGDRKTVDGAQQSLSDYIGKTLGIKKSIVDTLIRFGSNVGPMGLAGLLAKENLVSMALREINQINARLKNADLTTQIAGRANKLSEAGATQEAMIKEAGEIASKKILEASNELASEDSDNNDDDNEEETAPDDLPPAYGLISKKRNKKAQLINPPKKAVKPTMILEIISGMQKVLKQLKEDFEDCKRIDEIDQAVVEAKWERLEDYWAKLCCKLGEAGLS